MAQRAIMIPEPAAPLALFLDGSRNLGEIRSALALRFGLTLTLDDVRSMVGQLDEALLIENGEYRRAHRRALAAYRDADCRQPSHAGAVYPSDADELSATIAGWQTEFGAEDDPQPRPSGDLAGMLCPHIDYGRGHATYAKLFARAEDDLADVETIIALGTDHYGGLGRITPTAQSYATPYGVLPTDADAARELADALGDRAFDEELHHTREHSIELAAVWLHHFTRGRKVSFIPVLCGSFHEFATGDAKPEDNERIEAALGVLSRVTRERRTLVAAAGDLAHVGPAFGDDAPLDDVAKARVRAEDAESLAAVESGDAKRFLDISRGESDRRKICGLPPIYLMLRLLDGATGVRIGYDQCAADEENGSVVSIAGALLYR